jgi:hypothetical protein
MKRARVLGWRIRGAREVGVLRTSWNHDGGLPGALMAFLKAPYTFRTRKKPCEDLGLP